jgi:hypothetical protein
MPSYRDLLEHSKLFQQFSILADREDISSGDAIKLQSLVGDVAEHAGPLLERIIHTFPQYTSHAILPHSLNIADLIYRILPKRTLSVGESIKLNALELAVLWLSILLHDVGMYVDDAERQSLLKSEKFHEFLHRQSGWLTRIDQARRAGLDVLADAIEDALFAEFIRRCHAVRVRCYMDENLARALNLDFRGSSLSPIVMQICESHAWGVRESINPRNPREAVTFLVRNKHFGPTRINSQYLACCLRLGDIMDFDRTRTPISAFERIGFTDEISIQEWRKHQSITGWEINAFRARYEAECEAPGYYVAVQQFLDWIDKEIQDCRYLLDEAPAADVEKYALTLAHVVDRRDVRMKDPKYVAGGFRFQLEFDEIMQLLMEKSLYPSPTLFLRELLQNSLDACRYQQALAAEKGMHDKYKPRIFIQDLADDAEKPRIIFSDNGIGMSLDTVQTFFLRVGHSFYRSAEFRAEKERLAEKGITFGACSKFGIGFLACFLAGEEIEVITFPIGGIPLRISISGPNKYFLIERLTPPKDYIPYQSPTDEASDRPPSYSGTSITISLKPGWYTNENKTEDGVVLDTLKAFAVNQEFEIKISHGSQTKYIAANQWDHSDALPPSFRGTDPGHDNVKSDELLSIMIPSRVPIENWEFSKKIRGGVYLWFLRGDDGKPAIERGRICLTSRSLLFQSCISTVLDSAVYLDLEGDELSEMLAGYVSEDSEPKEFLAQYADACDVMEEFDHESLVKFSDSWFKLSSELRVALVRVLSHKPKYNKWFEITNVPSILSNHDDEVICDRLAQSKIGAFGKGNVRIMSALEVAGFGIAFPAGVVHWVPMKGLSQPVRPNEIFPPCLTARVDIWDDSAYKPSANRLFILAEDFDKMRENISRAALRHGFQLSRSHENDSSWQVWFKNFALSQLKDNPSAFVKELSVLHDFVTLNCIVGGETVALRISDIVKTFGTEVPMADTDENGGLTDGITWTEARHFRRRIVGESRAIDLALLADAVKVCH